MRQPPRRATSSGSRARGEVASPLAREVYLIIDERAKDDRVAITQQAQFAAQNGEGNVLSRAAFEFAIQLADAGALFAKHIAVGRLVFVNEGHLG